jgi:hypothetical protein
MGGLDGLIQGAKEDLEEFGKAIAADLIRAVREKREDLLGELGHQLEVIAEINRIRLVNTTWAQISSIVQLVGRVAIKTVIAAVV